MDQTKHITKIKAQAHLTWCTQKMLKSDMKTQEASIVSRCKPLSLVCKMGVINKVQRKQQHVAQVLPPGMYTGWQIEIITNLDVLRQRSGN